MNITNHTKVIHIKTTAKQDKKEVPGVISVDEAELKHHLSGIVRTSVEETPNARLDAEAAPPLNDLFQSPYNTIRWERKNP